MTEGDSALSRGRIRGLDGARGAACLCVVIVHSAGLLAPTTTARHHLYLAAQMVVLFFVLSGFLIFLPFVRRVAADDRLPDLRRYTSRRLRRIYPAYFVVFVLADLTALLFTANAVENLVARTDTGTGRITDPLTVITHLTLVQNLLPSGLQTGLNVSWSLTTELCFYLVLPAAGFALLWTTRRHGWSVWTAVAPGVLFVVLGLAGKTLLHWDQLTRGLGPGAAQFGSTWHATLTRGLIGQADTFGWGMIVVGLFVTMERGGLLRWTGWRVVVPCVALIAVGLAGTLWCVRHWSRYDGSFFALAVAAFALLAVEPTARGRHSLVGAAADVWPLRQVGDISLSVYLWHYPVLLGVVRAGYLGTDSPFGWIEPAAAVTAISLFLGWVTYRVVELPTRG